jgi:hypothetical protein
MAILITSIATPGTLILGNSQVRALFGARKNDDYLARLAHISPEYAADIGSQACAYALYRVGAKWVLVAQTSVCVLFFAPCANQNHTG